jgi:3-keto-disaccharide hydrolase
MRPRFSLTLTLGLLGLLGPLPATDARAQSVKPPEGFVALFNGDDLAGWHGMPHFDPRTLAKMSDEERAAQIAKWTEDAKKHWSVKDGDLINDGHGAYLTTDKDYGDIELLIDYKTVSKADSGIYLRANPQVQIWDYTKEGGKQNLGADKGSGGLWNNSTGAPGKDPLVFADKPLGEWNSLKIVQIGARTTITLNGKLVVDDAPMENFFDRKSPHFARGPIQLQTHGGEIRWKNVFLREIPPAEANKYLAEKGKEGFKSIFDGKTTEGWQGPINNYEIVDGSLRCKAGKGGTIYYNKELADFVARVEFRLPPGGNNGLAIRYPGKGDTAYDGMSELQILDDTSPKYGKLDPRQAHGSAYGMAAAKRGYLRPVGEWNFEEVTVKGSKIKVELNGTVILDTDLSTVHEYMANSAHPGKDRTSGFFGFAGHNDPVEFRNVSIKPIE